MCFTIYRIVRISAYHSYILNVLDKNSLLKVTCFAHISHGLILIVTDALFTFINDIF